MSNPSRPDPAAKQATGGLDGSDPAVLGRYRLISKIASGGMATVFLATASGPGGFEKVFALKRIHPHLADESDFVDMFLDEARIASRIHHSNVCQVFDFGEADGTYYLAMEYLLGESLARIAKTVRRSKVDFDDSRHVMLCVKVVADACEGLHAAHELKARDGQSLGVVHRDVSPQNLFITYDGNVKVVDFGIARASDRVHHTAAGQVKGKFSYMAPEQARGKDMDRRADVWALGVVLWEMMTLRRLFRRESTVETLASMLNDPIPPPSTHRPDIAPELDAIVLKALERDMDRRYATARDLGRDLVRFAGSTGLPAGMADLADWMERLFPGGRQKAHDRLDMVQRGEADGTVVTVTPVYHQESSESEIQSVDSARLRQAPSAPPLGAPAAPAPAPWIAAPPPAARAPSEPALQRAQAQVPWPDAGPTREVRGKAAPAAGLVPARGTPPRSAPAAPVSRAAAPVAAPAPVTRAAPIPEPWPMAPAAPSARESDPWPMAPTEPGAALGPAPMDAFPVGPGPQQVEAIPVTLEAPFPGLDDEDEAPTQAAVGAMLRPQVLRPAPRRRGLVLSLGALVVVLTLVFAMVLGWVLVREPEQTASTTDAQGEAQGPGSARDRERNPTAPLVPPSEGLATGPDPGQAGESQGSGQSGQDDQGAEDPGVDVTPEEPASQLTAAELSRMRQEQRREREQQREQQQREQQSEQQQREQQQREQQQREQQQREQQQQAAAVPGATGRVVVFTPGGWANVYDDAGRFLGQSPVTVTLSAGAHRLQIRPFGQPPARRVRVDVPAGGTANVRFPVAAQ